MQCNTRDSPSLFSSQYFIFLKYYAILYTLVTILALLLYKVLFYYIVGVGTSTLVIVGVTTNLATCISQKTNITTIPPALAHCKPPE